MPIIIFGTRTYGAVESHAGEYAATQFAHVYFVPLVPIRGLWIRGRGEDGPVGHATAMCGKSVLAAYLRVWGPVLAFAAVFGGAETGNIPLMLAAIVPAALTAWSWTLRSLRTDAARRRSDFNLAAFGTRCEPRLMQPPLRADLKLALDHEWNARKPNKSPNDVAVHGASDLGEAIIAYGLLRLAAVERRRPGGSEDASADQILAGDLAPAAVGDGPYRAAPVMPGEPDVVAAPEVVAPAPVAAPAPKSARELAAAERDRVSNYRLGLIVLTVLGLGGLAIAVSSRTPPLEPTREQLLARYRNDRDHVRIACDAFQPGWVARNDRRDVEEEIALCVLGDKFIPVKLAAPMATLPEGKVVIRGLLGPLPTSDEWVSQGLLAEPQLQPHRIDGFVDATNPGGGIAPLFALVFTAAMPVGWVLYIRFRRRQRRQPAAA